MPLDQRPDRMGGEIVGADQGERAAVAADRGPGEIADEGFCHGGRGPSHSGSTAVASISTRAAGSTRRITWTSAMVG